MRRRDLREGLDEMLDGAMDLLGADMGNIQILNTTRRVLHIAAHRGFLQDFLHVFREVSADDNSACGRALAAGQRVVIENTETDELFAPFG
jgi:GAF domain-containing protein